VRPLNLTESGLAFDNWLLYGTGGFAYGHVKSSLDFAAPTVPILVTGSTSETRAGWAVGAGVNYAGANWIFGIEYLHYDLGRSRVTAAAVVPALPASTLTATQRVDGDIVRGTLSYRFN
jgi:outer membrane immunogenic protein